MEALPHALVAQVKLSLLLGCGFAFSLLGVGGLGSLIAFAIGLHARATIKRSDAPLAGLRLAWWCILFGGVGAVFLPLKIAWIISSVRRGGLG